MDTETATSVMTTMEWVTFWIAAIGFILSVYNFVEHLIRNSRRLCVDIKHLHNTDSFAIMLVEFTNRSQLGISITSGKIVDASGKAVAFGETGCELFRYEYPELKGKASERTVTFPIHIDPLRSVRVLLQTEDDLPGFSRSYAMELGSSRGKISKNVGLPTAHEDFVSLLQHLG